MPEIADFYKNYVKLPVSIGSSHKYTGVSEKISDPGYTTAIGLMLDDMDSPREHKKPRFEGVVGKAGSKLKDIIKGLMP
jgi:cell division ATPase FtsA